MKTLCKKVVAMLAAVAILASFAVIPTFAETAETIVINCIDQFAQNPQLEKGWGHASAIGKNYSDLTQKITAQFTAEVEAPGWYNVQLIEASWSSQSAAGVNFSKVNFWIDSKEPQWLADQSAITGAGSDAAPIIKVTDVDPLGTSQNFRASELLEYVYLDEGTHTFNFETFSPNRAGDTLKVGFHSITLTPIDVDNITIMCADQKNNGYNGVLNEVWDGGIGRNNYSSAFNAGFKVKVYNKGWYKAKFIAQAAVTKQHVPECRSLVDWRLDRGEWKNFADYTESDNPTLRTIEVSMSSPYEYSKTELLEYLYLDEGEHLFEFTTTSTKVRFPNEGYRMGFHSITLERQDIDNISIICAEQAKNGYNSVLTENWSGCIGKNNYPTAYNAGFSTYVYKDGWYNVEFIAQAAVTNAHIPKCRSKVDWRLDGGEWKNFADSSMSDKPTLRTITASMTSPIECSKTELLDYIYLKKGEHLFEFTTTSPKVLFQSEGYRMGFHSITLKYVDTSGLNDITLHGGDYPNLTVVDAEGNEKVIAHTDLGTNLKDGTKVLYLYKKATKVVNGEPVVETTDGYKIKIPFTVYDDGLYDISMGMRAATYLPTNASGWESEVYIGIDAEEPKLVKTYATDAEPEINAEITGKYDNTYFTGLQPERWRMHDLKPVELAAGKHTLVIHIPYPSALNEGNLHIFGLDKIHIRPATGETSVVIEGENMEAKDKSAIIESDAYTGGKALNVTNAAANAKKWFMVSKAGNYRIIANSNGTGSYKIDSKAVSGMTEVRDLSSTYGDGWKQYRTTLFLDEGIHEFELASGSTYALDNIQILPAIEVTAISAEAKTLLSRGENALISVVNQNGETVTVYDVDTLCFESSDRNIVTVDGNGVITAVNQGEATITVGATVNGETYQDTVTVVVTGFGGLYVKTAVASGNDVTVTLEASEAVVATKVIVAVYEDGANTSLKEVGIDDFVAMETADTQTKTINLTSVENTDKISVFVFDSMNTFVPMCGEKIVR